MAINAYIALQADSAGVPLDTFKEWNWIQSPATSTSVAIDDDANVSTGWTMTVGTLNPEGEGSGGEDAKGTDDAAWVDEAILSKQFQFMTANVADYDFTGLDNGKTYRFEVFSSRDIAGNRITEFSVDDFTSVFGEINAVNNTTITVFVAGVSPASGLITLSVRRKSGQDNGYLNAIWIQEEGSGVVITDVNTTESWDDGDTGLVITGTGFV